MEVDQLSTDPVLERERTKERLGLRFDSTDPVRCETVFGDVLLFDLQKHSAIRLDGLTAFSRQPVEVRDGLESHYDTEIRPDDGIRPKPKVIDAVSCPLFCRQGEIARRTRFNLKFQRNKNQSIRVARSWPSD